jgi:hypothetical protein
MSTSKYAKVLPYVKRCDGKAGGKNAGKAVTLCVGGCQGEKSGQKLDRAFDHLLQCVPFANRRADELFGAKGAEGAQEFPSDIKRREAAVRA